MPQVSQIVLQIGAAPVHYVIADQGGNPLAPSAVTSWAPSPGLASGLVISADATGFFFSWTRPTPPPSAIPASVTATIIGPSGPVNRTFPIIVAGSSITDITLFQQ